MTDEFDAEAVTRETLERMLRKVQGLLAKAERTDVPEEEALYRAKAEELVRKYRLAEEDLIADDPTGIEPVTRKIVITETTSKFMYSHVSLFAATARHCGVRFVWGYVGREAVATVVGYPGDIQYAEFLHSAARLMMISKLEPTVDPSLSDEENVYRLRSAGLERRKVAAMVFGEATHANNAKVTRLYVRACEARGEDPELTGRSMNAKTFREAYANSFLARYSSRLREARDAADSTGGALTLHGRAERVDEAFYTLFPSYRPAPPAEGDDTPGTPVKRDGRRKDWTKAAEARWQRLYESPTARAARRAGASAADAVQIQRGSERARRVEEGPEGTTGAANAKAANEISGR